MQEDSFPPKILLRHKIVAIFWGAVAYAIFFGIIYIAGLAINEFFGVRLDQWNNLTIGLFAGLGAWAIIYLLDKEQRHRRQIDLLRRDVDRLRSLVNENYVELADLRREIGARLPPPLPKGR